MKNEKGITLISLVIAIIVILILASISIYSATSTLRYAKYNKAKSEIEIIQAQVNKWNQELNDTNITQARFEEIKNYGEKIENVDSDTSKAIIQTFGDSGINDENLRENYRFFSEQYLKDTLGLDASFDYLISVIDRDTILVGGAYYNGKGYFTLNDFGILNIENNIPSSISFDLEQGENNEIVISNVELHLKNSMQNDNSGDISKFIVEYTKSGENNWTDITKDVVKFEDGEEGNKTTKYKFSVKEFGEYEVRVRSTDKKLGGIEKNITLEARPGIKVGDYITYTSPTASVTFTEAETGYSGMQDPLERKTLFRVMDIDEDGNITLIGAMTSDDPTIYFNGAKGYNNAVYTLNAKCSELYKDESKGITARSIKAEDITDKFNQTGKDKLTTYVSNKISSLSPSTNVTKNKNEDDEFDNTVTYSNGNTNYPDIFQYEAGGLIDGTATSGVIGQSESYSKYGGLTDLAEKSATTSLTVPYTYYNTTHTAGDFEDSAKASAYQNMFFGTGTYYWLASRCIYCSSSSANFGLRFVDHGDFSAGILSYSGSAPVCPVVYLPSSVKVTVSTDDSTYHQSKPHEVK